MKFVKKKLIEDKIINYHQDLKNHIKLLNINSSKIKNSRAEVNQLTK